MKDFAEGCVLVTYKAGKASFITAFTPDDLDLQIFNQDFYSCAFPQNISKGTQSSVFAFTVGSMTAYTWSFQYGSNVDSIIILSSLPYPHLFLNLLSEVSQNCPANDTNFDEDTRFNLVVSFINSWKLQAEGKVLYSSIEASGYFGLSNFGYSSIDPYHYFGKDTDYTKIWKSLLLNQGVAVIGDDESSICQGVFSLLGLFEPFKFNGEYLITNNPKDSRLFDTSKKYSIVGILTNNFNASKYKRKFGICLQIDTKTGQELDTIIIHKKQKLLYDLMETISNRNLETDPYHELLSRRLVTDDIDTVMCPQMKKKTLTFSELRIFETTRLVSEWMNGRTYRPELRESFLSNTPSEIVEKIETKDLPLALSAVNSIKAMFPNDSHFQSVMKKHRRLIEDRLGQINRRSSDSEL